MKTGGLQNVGLLKMSSKSQAATNGLSFSPAFRSVLGKKMRRVVQQDNRSSFSKIINLAILCEYVRFSN